MGTRKNVTQLMAKSATLSTRKFVRRLDTKSNAMMFQSKNAAKFRSRNVARFPKRSAEMSQEPTARRNTRDNVVQSPGNTASMFLTSIVTKFPRLNATTPKLSIVLQFPSKTAGRSQEDVVS